MIRYLDAPPEKSRATVQREAFKVPAPACVIVGSHFIGLLFAAFPAPPLVVHRMRCRLYPVREQAAYADGWLSAGPSHGHLRLGT
jgi:hypothetical protein